MTYCSEATTAERATAAIMAVPIIMGEAIATTATDGGMAAACRPVAATVERKGQTPVLSVAPPARRSMLLPHAFASNAVLR